MRKWLRSFAGAIVLVSFSSASVFGQKTEPAADKVKREQSERAAVIAENERITRANEAVARAFAAGNTALAAKNYDAAIAEYDKGIAADPKHPGLSSLHTNKSVALRYRAVQEFNAAVQLTDVSLKEARLQTARKDFRLALHAANEGFRVINAQPQPISPAETATYKANKYAVLVNRAEAYRVFVSKVDKLQADGAMNAYKEYWLVEESATKKFKTRVDAGMMLMDARLYERAALEFRSVLDSDRANVDALFGLGFALFAPGIKTNYREALTSLQKFEQLAPVNHPRREDAKLMLDYLKADLGL